MNYILPEGFDFYEELKKENEDQKTECDYNNSCLISGVKLDPDTSLRLECGHMFNYVPLFNDVQESKYGDSYKSHYTYSSSRLRDHQLRCPYCRQIQNCILPYYPELIKKRVRGVNYPFCWGMTNTVCDYKFKSGKNKGLVCGRKCNRQKCHLHFAE